MPESYESTFAKTVNCFSSRACVRLYRGKVSAGIVAMRLYSVFA